MPAIIGTGTRTAKRSLESVTYFTTCSKCRKLAIVEKDQVDELKKLATQA